MNLAYKTLIVYYFSGTGNAKRAAEWIVDKAKEQGVETYLINIDRFTEISIPPFEGKALIGFCSATHGFNMPPLMLKFIIQFPTGVNADVFLLNTRAGMKLYKLFTPGLSGAAQIFPASVLRLKGYKIKGMQPLDMPSNWISVHPGIRSKVVNSIVERCHRIVNQYIEKLLSGKRVYTAFWSLPLDIAILPITFLYYFIGRFALAKTFIATTNCNMCEVCLKQCPVKAIEIKDNRMYWSFTCESCMRCMNKCPHRAIETPHLFVFVAWFLIFSVIPTVVMRLLLNYQIINFEKTSIEFQLLETVIEIGLTFLLLFIFYRIFHFLMRYRAFSKIIQFTSLTYFKFWRRYYVPRQK